MEIFIFIVFACIGSFGNVCIGRIPIGQSVAYPSSYCPKCLNKLKGYHLVPLVSYALLGGKCGYCKTTISIKYPIVELLFGLFGVFLYIVFGWGINFMSYSLLIFLLIIITFIDIEHKIIPDGLIIFGIALGMFFNILYFKTQFLGGLLGFLIGGSILLIIALVTGGSMGGGDIKLMAMIGLYLGLAGTRLTMFLSFIAGGVFAVILMIYKRVDRKYEMPFGPFICASALVALVWGDRLLNWYLNLF
jgi:leader peptidase (prepilin peptidase) / N-methyltransferase